MNSESWSPMTQMIGSDRHEEIVEGLLNELSFRGTEIQRLRRRINLLTETHEEREKHLINANEHFKRMAEGFANQLGELRKKVAKRKR